MTARSKYIECQRIGLGGWKYENEEQLSQWYGDWFPGNSQAGSLALSW